MNRKTVFLKKWLPPVILSSLAWSFLLIIFFSISLNQDKSYREKTNLRTARSAFQQVATFRSWNAFHGGVYVPITDQTQPNPFLEDPLRDVETTNGLKLTKINPAFMTRQAAELEKKRTGVSFHITSLKPINPINAAFNWERPWLQSFENGKKEGWQLSDENGQFIFQYMAPLLVKSKCLQCHAKQGYRINEIRGGISISFPTDNPTYPNFIWTYALVFIAGIIAIIIGFRLQSYQTRRQQEYLDNINKETSTRKQREEEIAHHKKILDQIHDSVFIFDSTSLLFYYANKAALQQTGYCIEDMEALTPAELLPDFSLQHLRKKLAPLNASLTDNILFETTLQNKHGKLVDIEVLAQKIFWGQRTSCYITIIRDVTERNSHDKQQLEMEKKLHEAQRLESVATLAGGITHDFNNLLTVIIGYAELTKDSLANDSQAIANMDTLLQAGYRARDLTKQILSFSRSTSTEKKPLMLHLIIKESLKMLKQTLPSSIKLIEDIANQDTVVMADPVQIQQIIMNLCINAFHAMGEDGGQLAVTLKVAKLTDKHRVKHPGLITGSYVQLQIKDTGGGIAPAIIDRIYDPYFTTKEQGKGTGLGLAVVYGIVRDMNGHIEVKSSHAGTTFDIFLPGVDAVVVNDNDHSLQQVPLGNNEHILIIDDNVELVNLVEKMLLSLGYQVTCRTSSREALSAFKATPERFDLVITDQIMPGLTGTQLSKEMLKIKDIPIILCTGFSETISEETVGNYGIREFIMKPVIKNDLASSVRRVLDSR